MIKESEILKLFDLWNDAVKSGTASNVVKLYSKDAILLPTVSNRVRHNHEEIGDYFEHFLSRKPEGTIDEANIRVSGDIAVNSGLYTFTFALGSPQTVHARFTFVYRRTGGEWSIIEHHSSAMPEKDVK